jgi:hypothetical protein
MKDNLNDPKSAQTELPGPIATGKIELRAIPEAQKDIDPIFRKPRPRLPGTRVTFL